MLADISFVGGSCTDKLLSGELGILIIYNIYEASWIKGACLIFYRLMLVGVFGRILLVEDLLLGL